MQYSIARRLAVLLFLFTISLFPLSSASSADIVIGLDADMSLGSAKAGEAIRRGAELAIDEINRKGGVLGRQLTLVVKDHRGNPARGRDNVQDFGAMPNLVAVLGGLHTPVALYELETVHRLGLIYLVPWAAGTPVVRNGYSPNYVFRVSVRDDLAGEFLIKKALAKGFRKPALLLEQTGWGRFNKKAMIAALAKRGIEPAGTEWFLWGVKDMKPAIARLKEAGADVIIFVGNAPEGGEFVKSLASMPGGGLPVISHWGITGGCFYQENRAALSKVDLTFLQTHSFLAPHASEVSNHLAEAYVARYDDAASYLDIFAPAGTAHAYDLVHLLAMAITRAGGTDRAEVRDALERLEQFAGAVKVYTPPFTKTRHDALVGGDFHLARYNASGQVVPEIRHE